MANNVYELIDPASIIAAVRQFPFPTLRLGEFFPSRSVSEDRYALIHRLQDATAAAPVRAWDAEAPIGARPGVKKVEGELAPISQKYPLTERESRMLKALGASGNELAQAVVNEIFDDATRATQHIQNRLEIARGDVLVDGILTLNENGVQATVDYGVPAGHKVTAAASWAVAATDMIGHLRSWIDTYVTTNGYRPGRMLTSTRVIGFMQTNTGMRELFATSATPTLLSVTNINTALQSFSFPTLLEPYDLQLSSTAGSLARVIADDKLILLPPADVPIGETQFGITEEARNLVGAGLLQASQAPGVAVTRWATEDPVQTWTKAAAVALPVLYNPNSLFIADVVP